MRILVTGGAGFIGSNFVQHVLYEHDDDEIVTLDALTYAGSRSNLDGVLDHPRHQFVEGDICDRELVSELVTDVDAIVNFAAESHVDRAIEGAQSFVRTNVGGAQTLLEAAVDAEIDRFLQISTDEVYGQVIDGEFSANDRLMPRNPYAATKAGADLLAMSYQMTHGLPVLITRTCNNYGPRQHAEKLIPKFIQKAAEGADLPVYGDGTNIREWIYVEDNCRALDIVLREGDPGNIYNVGSGDERSVLGVTRAILDAVGGTEDQITFVEDRPGHDQRYALDTTKTDALGWQPEWSFEDGLDKTVEYYL
ncbi:dTDP-glucose 4,6-dehydratase [Salinibaculum rarum]|uniref:dTDP-glucose 4,6-dehydratase n=1 Tax=Salinibaculum rarum TaxID=3058903 RepID=UPI00265EB88D|nr:dTDP-glucose 4,6-dehydratase [Salinibaculum sp. KK48]